MANRFGFISTYPPTQCGLATFTSALRDALTASTGHHAPVARLVDEPMPAATGEAVDVLAGDPSGPARAAAHLDDCDAVILQHEFGIYGGADGQDVLALLSVLTVPTIVVLHTVLTDPTPHQRDVLEAVVAAATAVVTMTTAARDRLAAGYRVNMSKVSTIAHGAPAPRNPATSRSPVFRTDQPTVLTWGLLGPGKGIEWGIEAMALLRDVHPAPKYIIAGQTHPKVLAREGEDYRQFLGRLITRLSLSGSVTLDGRYRDAPDLAELVAAADLVLLPYDSTDQVTSGVLIEAVAAGKPVVATSFPHAVELLSGGAGVVVGHRDPAAISAALRTVLTRRDVAASMSAAATAAAPALQWSAVATEYRRLADRLITEATVVAA